LNSSSISHLSLSVAKLLAVSDSSEIVSCVDRLEKSSCRLGLVEVVDSLVVDDEGDLSNLLDSVSTSHHESGDRRGSDSRSQSVSLLSDVDLSVPSSPGLSGSEHSSTSTHVSESSLSSSVSTSSRNSRNTRNSSTSSP